MSKTRFGRCRFWNLADQWGVIERSDGAESVLCPLSAIENGKPLAVGQPVIFIQTMDHRGRHLAKNVRSVRPKVLALSG